MKNLILCTVLVSLAGCASVNTGIVLEVGQDAECKQKGCTVWTEENLFTLGDYAFRKGFEQGFNRGYFQGVIDAESNKPKNSL